MKMFMIFFCVIVALTSTERIRNTSLDDLSKYGKSFYRGNIGVVFDHVGTVTPTASWWYHSFVISLPLDDMGSIIRATFDSSTDVVKVSNSSNSSSSRSSNTRSKNSSSSSTNSNSNISSRSSCSKSNRSNSSSISSNSNSSSTGSEC
ncbi:hypothetical protein DPMN_052573 [Dreissena polymorpha]|uniref:Uncharacterized protein n=1 Tax=Dreissena polymorpha TaxID=45954 RepID=A0A9D4CL83_DREPO|nr:hypothetical protein DPMN_052573 [Dreissena polymorpha]